MQDPAKGNQRQARIIPKERSRSIPFPHYVLSALPHFLAGIVFSLLQADALAGLLKVDPIWSLAAAGIIIITVGVLLMLATRRARKEKWPAWWGAWLTYLGIVILGGFVMLISLLKRDDWFNQYNLFIFVIAGWVAIGLFLITRNRPMHGLLASVTVVAFTGIPAFESVSVNFRTWITLFVWFCLMVLSVLIIRIGRVRYALQAAILGSMVMLLPFAWVGIYHGGMLESGVPGPSWLQVMRVFLPNLSLAGCLLFGPQLAWHINFFGEDGDYFGIWRSRFALFGQVIALSGAVMLYWDFMSSGIGSLLSLGVELMAAGCVFFSLGFAMVLYSTNVDFSRIWASGMFISLLFLPAILLISLPGWTIYGIHFVQWVPVKIPYYPEFLVHTLAITWTVLTLIVLRSSPQMKRLPPSRKPVSLDS